MGHRIYFEPCFPRAKLQSLIVTLPRTFEVLNSITDWKVKWPTTVRCMTDSEIRQGRKRGAGHGYTHTRCHPDSGGCDTIWMNHYMTAQGYWLVFTHENLHHAFPDASESELNCNWLPYVYEHTFDKAWPGHDWARKHGVGSPVAGVGDRSYCR